MSLKMDRRRQHSTNSSVCNHFALSPAAKLIRASLLAGMAGSLSFNAFAQQEAQEKVTEVEQDTRSNCN